MSEREPRWDIDSEIGRQAEIWVSDLRQALQAGTVEVKRDTRAVQTGNIYVEYECKRRGLYRKSGIATTTANLWVFVLIEGEFAIVITTERLKHLARTAYKNPHQRKEEKDGSHPTRGVVIPIREMFRMITQEARTAGQGAA